MSAHRLLSENAPAEAPAAEAAPAEAAETPAEAPKEEKVCISSSIVCSLPKACFPEGGEGQVS